jgi:hypothetical protein
LQAFFKVLSAWDCNQHRKANGTGSIRTSEHQLRDAAEMGQVIEVACFLRHGTVFYPAPQGQDRGEAAFGLKAR